MADVSKLTAEQIAKIDLAIARASKAKAIAATTAQSVASETPEERRDRLLKEREGAALRRQQEQQENREQKLKQLEEIREKRRLQLEERRASGNTSLERTQSFASKLPPMSTDAQAVFDMAATLARGDLEILTAHLSFLARSQAVGTASNAGLKIGDTVKIIAGQPKFIGQIGKLTRVQRIRCFVDVGGKEVYLFCSDVQPIVVAAPAALQEEPAKEERAEDATIGNAPPSTEDQSSIERQEDMM